MRAEATWPALLGSPGHLYFLLCPKGDSSAYGLEEISRRTADILLPCSCLICSHVGLSVSLSQKRKAVSFLPELWVSFGCQVTPDDPRPILNLSSCSMGKPPPPGPRVLVRLYHQLHWILKSLGETPLGVPLRPFPERFP